MEVAEKKSILLSGDMLGCYRIENFLGQGGFGVTYLALDTKLDLQVAIKEYMPEQIAERTQDNSVQAKSPSEDDTFTWGLNRFIKEARTLAKFRHPNIVRIMAVFEQNGTAYMVMEYEKGRDLKSLINNPELCSEDNLKRLMAPVMDGLNEVHRHGYIHRDIKPANILIRPNGSPVLIDFGSARLASGNQTQALTALVSVGYAPLEQYNDSANDQQGPWTDIYALGAVLYFAITGNAPVDSTLRGSAVLNDRPDPMRSLRAIAPNGFSEKFCKAVDWALNFKVLDRPQSLQQWRSALLNDDETVLMPKTRNAVTTRHRAAENTDIRPSASAAAGKAANTLNYSSRPGNPGDNPHRSNRINEYLDHLQPASIGNVVTADNDAQISERNDSTDWETGFDDHKTPDANKLQHPGRSENQTKHPSTGKRRNLFIAGILALVALSAVVFNWTGRSTSSSPAPESSISTQTQRLDSSSETVQNQLLASGDEARSQREQAGLAEAEQQAQLQRKQAAQLEADQQAALLREKAAVAKAEQQAQLQREQAAQLEADQQASLLREKAAVAKAEQQAQLQREQAAQLEADQQAAQLREKAAIAEAEQQAQLQREQAAKAEEMRLELQELEQSAEAEARRQALVKRQQAAREKAAQLRQEQLAAKASATTGQQQLISDADFSVALKQFNNLSNAIRGMDFQALKRITSPSERKYAYFDYVFNNFDSIEVSTGSINSSRSDQTIRSTLQIKRMKRSNGDIAIPRAEFQSIPIYSTRDDDWSKVHW